MNNNNYYNRYSIEAIEMAKRIWGEEILKEVAEVTAFFYRMRAGEKPNNTVQQDLDKEKWWLEYSKNLTGTPSNTNILQAKRLNSEDTTINDKSELKKGLGI